MISFSSVREQVNQAFHASLYLGLQHIRGKPVRKYMRELETLEKLGSRDYRRRIDETLRNALDYAYRHVPLYSTGSWKERLSKRGPGKLSDWPLLQREPLIENWDQAWAVPRPRNYSYRKSSASTGKSLSIPWDLDAAAQSWACEYRTMEWHNVPIGVKTLMVWGITPRFANWVLNRRIVPATNLHAHTLDQAAQFILKERPVLLWALPSAAAQLARYMHANYLWDDQQLVPYAKVGGEQVYPFQRDEIRKYLGSTIVEIYGSSEMGVIANECPQGALHLRENMVAVEIFQDGEPAPEGEFGEIIVTSLVNRAMPIVRYQVGDRGRISPEPCSCGRPGPVLLDLQSRSDDMLMTVDGDQVHGSALGHALKTVAENENLDHLPQVLFHQIDQHSWEVLVESKNGWDERLVNSLTEVVWGTYGRGSRVEVKRVSMIPREASGKFRYYRK